MMVQDWYDVLRLLLDVPVPGRLLSVEGGCKIKLNQLIFYAFAGQIPAWQTKLN
jgi:hypothetical protein